LIAGTLTLALLSIARPGRSDDAALTSGLDDLKSSSFQAKSAAVGKIAESGAPRAHPILDALLGGHLYVRQADGIFVIVADDTPESPVSDALTGDDLGAVDRDDLKKIGINNQMRGALNRALARLSLRGPNAGARKIAVESLYTSLNEETLTLLRDALADEHDIGVRAALKVALALADVDDPDPAKRGAAVEVLAGSMHSEVRNKLEARLANDDAGAPRETDPTVRQATAYALEHIDWMRMLYGLAETVFFGLSLGFVLVLAATGLAITFGVMGVINMAHGELMMLGAYATWLVQQAMPRHLELSLFAAIPVAFLVSAIAGVAIERGVVRFLYGRPLETLLATFGVSLILQQGVRSVFSPLNRAVATPQWMSGQLVLNGALAITYNRLYIIVFSILVFLALVAILRFTTLGLQVRAVAQNRAMARAMGVRAGWVDAMTFGLGSGVAGLAGVALSQLTNVGPNLGQSHIVDSFMVVVFGGVGNLWGTLVAGLSLGIANKFLEPFAGAVLAKISVLVFIILFIQRRPRGLFPQRGRSADA
jgi:urea transport system permease protein